MWAAPLNANTVGVVIGDEAGNSACIDLDDCSVTSTTGGATGFAEDWGGMCRVGFAENDVVNRFYIYALTAAGACGIPPTGNTGESGLLLWGAQSTGEAHPSSYIKTTTASVTRLADVLTYPAGNAATSGTIEVGVVCPDYDLASDVILAGIGADADNRLEIYVDSANDRASVIVRNGGTTTVDLNGSAGDVFDGEQHTIRVAYDTNDVELFYDGASVGTDTSATMLGAVGALRVGSGVTAGQSGCAITRICTWDEVTTTGVCQ
jgi:hypothetical protein